MGNVVEAAGNRINKENMLGEESELFHNIYTITNMMFYSQCTQQNKSSPLKYLTCFISPHSEDEADEDEADLSQIFRSNFQAESMKS